MWIIKAVERTTKRTIAWVLGNRNISTVQKLYNKVKHLKECIFYTDNWKAFSKVLPKNRHVIGKAHTYTIEQDNSNIRHYLARMTRRTKVVSQKDYMVDLSIKLCLSLTTESIFRMFQNTFLSIFN